MSESSPPPPPPAIRRAALRRRRRPRSYLRLIALLSSILRHHDQISAVSLASGNYPVDPAPATSSASSVPHLPPPPLPLPRLLRLRRYVAHQFMLPWRRRCRLPPILQPARCKRSL
uniref:Uncharacterized protein n=1 Tax=Oryza punctata TaxID=4537 RepID=A0A0E0KCT0_ORYPU